MYQSGGSDLSRAKREGESGSLLDVKHPRARDARQRTVRIRDRRERFLITFLHFVERIVENTPVNSK
jgi:hypothetical protein